MKWKIPKNINKKMKKKNKEKTLIRIGTWNIKTMLKAGKMEEVAKEMNKYKMEIIALQEIRWKEEGKIDKENYTMFYGGEPKQGRNGTGFMISKKFRDKVLKFKVINGRITYIRMKNKQANITLVNVYAPTEDAQEEDKIEFYEKLEETCESIPRNDILIIVGDFNAMVGKEDYTSSVAGKYTIHEITNNNGTKLCNLAAIMNMTIISTKFKHKLEHKVTWMIPGRTTGNQIDHILIAKKWERIAHDVRSFRGANADTDHFLVMAKIKLKIIKGNNKRNVRRKWDIEKLRNKETVQKFRTEVEKCLTRRNKENIEEEWQNIKNCITDATEKVLGKKRAKRNEWFDEECMEHINMKNQARIKWISTEGEQELNEYKEKRKTATRICKNKKQQWMQNFITEIEADSKDNRKLFNYIKKLNSKNKTRSEKIDSREWENYFTELYRDKENKLRNGEVEDDQERNEEDQPSFDEFTAVIKKLKTGKATGADEINNELIKYGGEIILERIYKLMVEIWREEIMPSEWRRGVLVPILKKGDPTLCQNYRGIMLLNTAYKILTSIIRNRLEVHLEAEIGDYQQGFRKGRSTIDAIHILTQTIEKCAEYNIELHMLFIDFKQAFDSLIRYKLVEEMQNLNIPKKLINLIKMTMERSEAVVTTHEGTTNAFNIETGVRQGDALSTSLFNIALEGSIRALDHRGTIANKSVQLTAYADDIVIVARSRKTLIDTLLKLEGEAKNRGLIINENKTKYMVSSRQKTNNIRNITVGKYLFEKVDNFKYLGVTINGKNERSEEIQERIQAGNRAYYACKNLLHNNNLNRRTKMRTYKATIRPVVTYASETMCLTKKDEEKLRTFERKIVRKIMGPKQTEGGEYRRLMNFEIRNILEEDIVNFIKAQRIRWYGHIHRRDPGATIKRISEWKPEIDRPRGRPRGRWEDQVIDDLRTMGIRGWRADIKDRKKWNKIVDKAKTEKKL